MRTVRVSVSYASHNRIYRFFMDNEEGRMEVITIQALARKCETNPTTIYHALRQITPGVLYDMTDHCRAWVARARRNRDHARAAREGRAIAQTPRERTLKGHETRRKRLAHTRLHITSLRGEQEPWEP